ncbi:MULTISPECIES: urea amidolyase associated protein UAAP1 [unclassified Streptomyces]|uniref:urea amidolyase associated protein UAAP1 n=1 Tax=unclassified Streptomyces TaxID=2593676 RepID=UPI002DD804F5|nr:urea amidolyase associated protein UAAP1 [Streptomyces sp. NBC_01750]WSB03858.1 urea carboxylase-associated family protein [Streptomyces sp. NBC_01794]WSD31854.1 urea carboxylase-associated family protein [Streptomyces sp. NBC_01750]
MATATTYGARDHARAQDGARAEAMPVVPATDWPAPPREAGHLVWAETVAGGNYTHRVFARGTELRLTDPHGDACAHVLLFVDGRPWERLNTADTVKVQWNAYLRAGQLLLSDQGRVLATLVADTTGRHDALCGTSTLVRNTERYGDGAPHSASPAGRELLKLAALKNGLEPRDLPPSLSFFQGVEVRDDGALDFTGSAGPGASVTLRAEQDVTVLIANVPHPLDPRPEYTSTALEVLAWRAAPTAPGDPLWEATPEGRRAFANTIDFLASRGLA